MIVQSNLDREFEAIEDVWSPRVIAEANGQYVKIARARGEFVWHAHAAEDEFFLVHRGELVIHYRDGEDVVLGPGDFHVVPRGREHMTEAREECWILMVEPVSTRHTGETESDLTKPVEAQIAHLTDVGR
ncbi:Mannose-6-phosphate isomerase, cupin superfamily [Faunimonas pinastri]|uniref:Mannose-6-phosphate isomerase, cupin superfamily n=1 Tax=Faunimonas pinastri TaxID=1855383 RepID=A0A1H9AX05_9HYPH|nr:cupin domain-containing protein [Faunimonas pinastri]SEP80478.1 Mannose-6-phosphate isomerase, cupin superfamily [Faunimonas pinastri]